MWTIGYAHVDDRVGSCDVISSSNLIQAERSEALLPKAAGAEGAPEQCEGFKQKLEAYMVRSILL